MSVCSTCSKEVMKLNKNAKRSFGCKNKNRMIDLKCPFVCPECKTFHFDFRAIRDVCFIWPIPRSKKYNTKGVILRPLMSRDVKDEQLGRSDDGIMLSCGPGYYDDKKFNLTTPISVGTKIVYDKLVLWGDYSKGYDGKLHYVILCGYKDIKGII